MDQCHSAWLLFTQLLKCGFCQFIQSSIKVWLFNSTYFQLCKGSWLNSVSQACKDMHTALLVCITHHRRRVMNWFYNNSFPNGFGLFSCNNRPFLCSIALHTNGVITGPNYQAAPVKEPCRLPPGWNAKQTQTAGSMHTSHCSSLYQRLLETQPLSEVTAHKWKEKMLSLTVNSGWSQQLL